MNAAIRQFRPASNWISAVLLTAFVVSIAFIAEELRPGTSGINTSDLESSFACCSSNENASQRVLLRYH